MEKYLLEKFEMILEQENDIKNVSMYVNLEGNWVITYEYNNEKYLIDIERGV